MKQQEERNSTLYPGIAFLGLLILVVTISLFSGCSLGAGETKLNQIVTSSTSTTSSSTSTTTTVTPTTGILINNGETSTGSTTVQLTMKYPDAILQKVSLDSSFQGVFYETFFSPRTFALFAPGETIPSGTVEVKTVYARFRTRDGAESSLFSDSIVFDTRAKTNSGGGNETVASGSTAFPTGTVSVNNGANFATQTTVMVTVNSINATKIKISNSSDFSAATSKNFTQPQTTYEHVLSVTQTNKEGESVDVYVELENLVTNKTTISDRIIYDAIPPDAITITIEPNPTTQLPVFLKLVGGDGAREIVASESFSGLNSLTQTSSFWQTFNTTLRYTLENPATRPDNNRLIYLRAKDLAGNELFPLPNAPVTLSAVTVDAQNPIIAGGAADTANLTSVLISHSVDPTPAIIIESKDGVTFSNRPYSGVTTFDWATADLSDADGKVLTYFARYEDSASNSSLLVSDTINGPAISFDSFDFVRISDAGVSTYTARVRALFSGADISNVNIFVNENYSLVESTNVVGAAGGAALTSDGLLTQAEISSVNRIINEFDVEMVQGGLPKVLYAKIGDTSNGLVSDINTVIISALNVAPKGNVYDPNPADAAAPYDDVEIRLQGNVASGPYPIVVDGSGNDYRVFQDTDSLFDNGPGILITGTDPVFDATTNPGWVTYPGKDTAVFWRVQDGGLPFNTQFTGNNTFIHYQMRDGTTGVGAVSTQNFKRTD